MKTKLLLFFLIIPSLTFAEWFYWPAYYSAFDAELRSVSAYVYSSSCSIQFNYDLINKHGDRTTYVSNLDLTFTRGHSVYRYTHTVLAPGTMGRYYAYTIYDCELARDLLERHTSLSWARISTSSAPTE